MYSSESSEVMRLQVLEQYNILNSDRERNFDDIAVLAAAICEMPVGLVSFVSRDKVWFKARYGTDLESFPAAISFCAETISQTDDILVIQDIRTDERFSADARAAHEAAGVRFYAGAPVVSPEGFAVGAVCVADFVPRTFSPQKAQALAVLARQVVSLLELRRHVSLLQMANAKLAEQTMTDDITCVPNRRAFDQKLLAEGARAQRTKQNMSLLLVEVDAFQTYRTEHGDVAGDMVLHAIAQLLAANARPYDYVSRYDDHRFSVILPGTNHLDAALVATRLRASVASANWPERRHTISVGISHITEASDGPSLLLAADMALHQAKSSQTGAVLAA